MLWIVIAPTISAITGVGRDAQRQHRDERGLRARVVGRLRAGDAADVALAEWRIGIRTFREFLLDRVRRNGREQRAAARQYAENRTEAVPRATAGAASFISLPFGMTEPTLLVKTSRWPFFSTLAMISAKPNTPIATATKPMPSVSSGMPKLKRDTPEFTSVPTKAEQQAEHDHPDRLQQRTRREHDGADQAQHHQREVFGRTELEGEFGQRRRKRGDQNRCDAAGEERADRRDRRARGPRDPGAPSGSRRDRSRPKTIHPAVDQNRRGRAAVLRTVVDAGQHDQRGRRRPARVATGAGQQHAIVATGGT
jgi:hypothetical protein